MSVDAGGRYMYVPPPPPAEPDENTGYDAFADLDDLQE